MRILVTGASGQLGAYLIHAIQDSPHELIAWSGPNRPDRGEVAFRPIDLAQGAAIDQALEADEPDVVIHAAAISAADAVRLDRARAETINVGATRRIAEWCGLRGKRLIFTSTDLVFDGSRTWNREEDPTEPIIAYGQTKRVAEAAVLACDSGLVTRLPLLFGPSRCGRPYFYTRAIEALERGEPQTFFEDEFRTPLDLRTASQLLVKLAEVNATGLLHVAGLERVSRFALMTRVATALNLDANLVKPNRRLDVNLAETRPADVSLNTSKLTRLFPEFVRPVIETCLRELV